MRRPRFVDWMSRIKVRFAKRKPIAYGTGQMPMPTQEAQAKWHTQQWESLSPELRDRAAIMLRKLPEWQTVADFVRSEHASQGDGWIHYRGGHHGWGMAIRNYLRSGKIVEYRGPMVLFDARTGEKYTPTAADHVTTFESGFPGIEDDQLPSGNWDDYYTQALEFAAGVRDA